jgi:hypothetical protein
MADTEQTMQNDEPNHLQEQIWNVRRQLWDLDAQKIILLGLLDKLENVALYECRPILR